MLSDEQIKILTGRAYMGRIHESPYAGMLQEAYRLGMLRAAEIAREAHDSAFPVAGHVAIADAIRAEAG